MADHTTASTPFERAFRDACQAAEANHPEAAIVALQEALRLDPSSARAQFLLGAQYAQIGRMDDAERALAVAVVQEPALAIARFQLGLLQLTCGRAAQAAATWQALDALPDTHCLRIFAHGLILLADDRFEAASDALRRGMEANLDNPALNRDMQRVLERIADVADDAAREPSGQQNLQDPQNPQSPAAADDGNHFLLSTYQQQGLH